MADSDLSKLLDDEAFQLLSRKVKAEEEANRLSQATLTSLKLQNRLNTDTLQRYAHLAERIDGVIIKIESRHAKDDEYLIELQHTRDALKNLTTELRAFSGVQHEVMDELSRRQDRFENNISQRLGRLEDLELMQLSGQKLSKKQAETAITTLQREQKQRELQQLYINLADYRLDAAKYGTLDVPIRLRNEIRQTEEAIAQLEEESG